MTSRSTRNKNNNKDEPLPIASLRLLAPPLRLVSAAMWKVMQQRDAMHYGKLEEFVMSVSETVPGLLSYRHQAKLCVGLRARMILEQLRVAPSSELVLPQLKSMRVPAVHSSKGTRIDQKVEMAVKNFHTLVQTLLENPAEREQFFKAEFDSQYGPQYECALEKLLWEFLTRLDQLLPVPDLAQTVSWLTAAPAVLEECARSASQPQLLRTLLLHEKCLGHLKSAASVPSTTGDSILSSLSLPLSGKVQDSNQSGSSPTPNMVSSRTSSSAQKSSKRSTRETVSHITPVIGSISAGDVSHEASTDQNVSVISEKASEEEVTEVSKYTVVTSHQKDTLNQELCVGKLPITVLNLSSTSSEVEDEDESEIRPETRSSQKNDVNDKKGIRSSDRILHLRMNRKTENRCRRSLRKSCYSKQQEEEGLNAVYSSCSKRQLKVIIPRMKVKGYFQTMSLKTLPNEHSTMSPKQSATEGVSTVSGVGAMTRKRKLSISATPEKNLSIDKQVNAGSPCIPTLVPLRMENSDMVSPVSESPDEIIVDSEDEATENVKGRLFRKRYCKTKSNTYIPTLHEFWTPAFFRRDLLSPGNGCR